MPRLTVHAVTIAEASWGSHTVAAFREARELGVDFLVFNGRLIPVADGVDLGNYLKDFPQLIVPPRLAHLSCTTRAVPEDPNDVHPPRAIDAPRSINPDLSPCEGCGAVFIHARPLGQPCPRSLEAITAREAGRTHGEDADLRSLTEDR